MGTDEIPDAECGSAAESGAGVLTDPGQWMAALPHVLGFYPVESIVLDVVHNHRSIVTLRADLPQDPLRYRRYAVDLVHQLPQCMGATTLAVIVSRRGDQLYLPLVDHLRREFSAAGFPITTYRVGEIAADCEWRSYDDPERCGVVPDPRTSVVAAMRVQAGMVTHRSREDLVAMVKPDPGDSLARRTTLIRARRSQQEQAATVRGERGGRSSSQRVRTYVERVLGGDGALASIALDRAEDANRDHPAAVRLRHALNLGIEPSAIREMVERTLAEHG